MTISDSSQIYQGGCHCGQVRFQVTVDRHEAIICNCSICAKKGFIHLIVSRDKFQLLRGQNVLTTYTFNTHQAKHTFCSICGIHGFYHPRSHPEDIDVNVRCLDGDVLDDFVIILFDGKNWEQNVAQIQG